MRVVAGYTGYPHIFIEMQVFRNFHILAGFHIDRMGTPQFFHGMAFSTVDPLIPSHAGGRDSLLQADIEVTDHRVGIIGMTFPAEGMILIV